MTKITNILGVIRAPFLLLTPACVSVGVATAFWETREIHWGNAILILLGALSAHICVNAWNEYFDFRSGLDAQTQKTPFSGGSGTLTKEPRFATPALLISIGSLILTSAVGAYFVWVRGWVLLPFGLFGLFLLVAYTPWLTRNPVTCLLAPGLGFGLLMTGGTHFALTGTLTGTAFLASLIPTFLVSNLLLLNQFPDAEADRNIGRRHYPILIGRKASSILYGAFLLAAYLCIVAGVIFGIFPPFCLLALITAIFAWQAWQGAYHRSDDIIGLVPSLGQNVVVNLLTPLLLALGFFLNMPFA